jgi:hypothetical protein
VEVISRGGWAKASPGLASRAGRSYRNHACSSSMRQGRPTEGTRAIRALGIRCIGVEQWVMAGMGIPAHRISFDWNFDAPTGFFFLKYSLFLCVIPL